MKSDHPKQGEKGGTPLVKGTPSPEAKRESELFFAHKKENPEPTPKEDLTPMKRRMQEGDA